MRKSYFFTFITTVSILLLIFAVSCKKENFNIEKVSTNIDVESDWAFAIAKLDIDLRDVLQDYDTLELFQEDETGMLYLMYHKKVASYNVTEKFKLGTQSYNTDLQSTEMNMSGFNTSGAQATYTESQIFDFMNYTPNDGKLDSIWIMEGICNMVITSTFEHEGELRVIFPSVTKNGVAYEKTYTIDASGSASLNESHDDLDDYVMDLTQTPAGTHQLEIQYELTLTHSGSANTSGNINISAEFTSLEYDAIFGYVGNTEVLYQSDSIKINIFDATDDQGYVYFEDPKFNIQYSNSFGIPIQFYFEEISTYSQITEEIIPIHPVNGSNELPLGEINAKIFDYPHLENDEYGVLKTDSIKLNKEVCNINEAIGTKPKYVLFKAKAESNPDGENHNNFISRESEVSADLEVVLPLWGYAAGFSIVDTIDFDFDDIYGDIDPIDYILFRLRIDNGFPIETRVQAYVADSNYVIHDSLILNQNAVVVGPGTVDANGKVDQATGKNTEITEIVFDRDRIESFHSFEAKKLLIRVELETTGQPQNVRFYSDYGINIKTASRVKLKTTTDELEDM